jgi:hypothetical protein
MKNFYLLSLKMPGLLRRCAPRNDGPPQSSLRGAQRRSNPEIPNIIYYKYDNEWREEV